jgi:hypothetical protein
LIAFMALVKSAPVLPVSFAIFSAVADKLFVFKSALAFSTLARAATFSSRVL